MGWQIDVIAVLTSSHFRYHAVVNASSSYLGVDAKVELVNNSQSRRVLLYSPVLPMKTGTADYFEHVLESLRRLGVPTHSVAIVVDSEHWTAAKRRRDALGFPIIDYRAIPDVVEPFETRVMFVANNELHAYVHRALLKMRRREGGRVISIIHDVSCAMILKHLSFNGIYGFSPDQYVRINRIQLGPHARKFIDDRQAGNISDVFEYVTHAQGTSLQKCDEIWTHSRFGALKLALESDLPVRRMPTIRVCSHPVYEKGTSSVTTASVLDPIDAKKPGVYRFGVFGWASPSKRIYEALRALRLLLARLEVEDRTRVEFIVVGALLPPQVYDPVGYARSLAVESWCRFFGFVGPDKFRALIDDCDCVLNLRFPSCGESSGSGAHARGSGVDVIMSACQAFNEEEATAHIEPTYPSEEFLLAGEMQRLFAAWRDKVPNLERPPPKSRLAPVDALLANEILFNIGEPTNTRRSGGATSFIPKDPGALSS